MLYADAPPRPPRSRSAYSLPVDCDNQIQNGGVPASSGCDMQCNGNQTEVCGGASRLNVYDYQMQFNPTATSSVFLSSTSSVPGPSSTSTSAPPAGTGFPTGWSSQGCWMDSTQGRSLSFQQPDSQTNTPQSCASLCDGAGYVVSGTEYGAQCFCGNGITNNGTEAAAGDCNMPCAGDATQVCGAGDRLSVVSKGPPVAILPPAPAQTVGNWTYQGCYSDNVNQVHVLAQQILFPGNMTPSMCLDRCAAFGFMAAGLEYGDECYCK